MLSPPLRLRSKKGAASASTEVLRPQPSGTRNPAARVPSEERSRTRTANTLFSRGNFTWHSEVFVRKIGFAGLPPTETGAFPRASEKGRLVVPPAGIRSTGEMSRFAFSGWQTPSLLWYGLVRLMEGNAFRG